MLGTDGAGLGAGWFAASSGFGDDLQALASNARAVKSETATVRPNRTFMQDLVPEILNERANRGFALRFWPHSLIGWMRRQPGWDVQPKREFGGKFCSGPHCLARCAIQGAEFYRGTTVASREGQKRSR